MSRDIQIHTYGCKVNSYDAGLMEDRLKNLNLSEEIHILNTCAVTAEATKEAVREARRIKRKKPESKVIITGCSAQVDTESFEGQDSVDLIVANSHKGELSDIIRDHFQGGGLQRTFKSNIFKKSDLGVGGGIESHHTRSFLKIQDGCNSFCTFCVIPFARGKSRSLSLDEIVDRVQQIYDEGIREVVITGIHIGDFEDDFFGKENKRGLEDLMEQLLIRTKMPRFRISSLEPLEITDRLLDVYQQDQMCPHFHVSLQSMNNKVLKGMKRQNTTEQASDCLKRIANKIPNVFVGMDVIVGFPGEGQNEFEQVRSQLQDLPWSRLHVFPYSERPGTYAVRLDEKNHRSESLRRSKILRTLSEQRYQEHLQRQLGTEKKVILLKNKKDKKNLSELIKTLSRDYWNVQLPETLLSDVPAVEEFQVKVTGLQGSELLGELF